MLRLRKILALYLLCIAYLFAANANVMGSPTVLMLAREKSIDMQFFLQKEALPMIELLTEAGFKVDVATQTGKSIEYEGIRLDCNVKLSEVHLDDYIALLVPCMGAQDYAVSGDWVALLREADSKGIIIAAQHSLEMLSPAGLIKGRKVSMSPGIKIDGNLITSYNCPYTAVSTRKPIDTDELIRNLVEVIKNREIQN